MARNKITIDIIVRLYDLAKKVYENNLSKDEALDIVQSEFVVNRNSATDYINNFNYMMQGKEYNRRLSAMGLKYYLENIKKDFSNDVFQNALLAAQRHVDYLDSLGGTQGKSLQKVLNEFKN